MTTGHDDEYDHTPLDVVMAATGEVLRDASQQVCATAVQLRAQARATMEIARQTRRAARALRAHGSPTKEGFRDGL